MKKLLGILLAVTLMGVLGVSGAAAQTGTGTVTGKAVRWTGEPVVGATIRALAGPLETDKELTRTTTGADGAYALAVPAGQPYWIHIDTLGTWWGYSYQVPFTLRPGEVISQVYFALGPRSVKDITLPAPVSNVAPATGTNPAPPVVAPPVVAPPAAPPVVVAPAAPAAPISNVKPALGYGKAPAVAKVAPRLQPQPAPQALPPTGQPNANPLLPALLGALVLLGMGLVMRSRAFMNR